MLLIKLSYICSNLHYSIQALDSFGSSNHKALNVSIIELIANSEKYHGKLVRLIGISRKYRISKIDSKKRVIAINMILFAALFGLISLYKEFLRPTFNNSVLLKTLSGCFPNIIASVVGSFFAIITFELLHRIGNRQEATK